MTQLKSNSIKTMIGGKYFELYFKPEVEEIPQLIKMGVVPIEMAEGLVSYVDDLQIDHHNQFADNDAACMIALKHYRAAEKKSRAIMVNHVDLDCVLAGMEVLGLLSMNVCEKLAPTVAMRDVDPFNPEMIDMPYTNEISVWQKIMGQGPKDSGWAWLYGAQMLREVIFNTKVWQKEIEQVSARESERIYLAEEDYQNSTIMDSGKVVYINPSRCFGFDVHLQRRPENGGINDLSGWKHWVAICLVEKTQKATISCPNLQIAEKVFGKGGLMNVFPLLPKIGGESWGGRQAIGGSPRNIPVTPEELDKAVDLINCIVKTNMDTLSDN